MAPKITYEDKYRDPQIQKADSILVLVVAVAGVPTPKVTWKHGEDVLTTTNGVTVETSEGQSRLSIKGVTGKDSGSYKVTAENIVGSDEAEFAVTVIGKYQ